MKTYLLDINGILSDSIKEKLNRSKLSYYSVNDISEVEKESVLIGVYDYFNYKEEEVITKYCMENNICYIRANLTFSRACIGPTFIKGSACISCLHTILANNNTENEMVIFDDMDLSKSAVNDFKDQYSYDFIRYITEGIADELSKVVNKEKLNFQDKVAFIENDSLRVSNHRISKDELCRVCSDLPKDSAELSEVMLKGGKKLSNKDYRTREIPKLEDIKKLLVDMETGKIRHNYKNVNSDIIPIVASEVYRRFDHVDGCYGRCFDYESSEVCAILESLERYSCTVNKKSITNVYGSYNELKEHAVNPSKFGLHKKEQLNLKGFKYKEYTEDLKYNWVWAWSMKHNKAVLVPEQMVYFGIDKDRFVYETSNGCALGSSVDEALFYGLLEVIERDNFMVSWYNRLPLVEIDVERSGVQEIAGLEKYMKSLGYSLHFYDMSMELGIPSIWGLVINDNDGAVVRSYSAAGANPNPESALKGALVEIITSIRIYEKKFDTDERKERREVIVSDYDELTEFEDHVLFYSHDKAIENLSFVLNNSIEKKSLQELYPKWYDTEEYKGEDLKDDVINLLNKVLDYYEDVYVVDTTCHTVSNAGYNCVKVFVPGMLTMSFGHQHRRIVDDRVLKGPVIAGRLSESIAIESINTDPHPFP